MPRVRIDYGNLYSTLLTPWHGVAGIVGEELSCDSPGHLFNTRYHERVCPERHITAPLRFGRGGVPSRFGRGFKSPKECGDGHCGGLLDISREDCKSHHCGSKELEHTWDGKKHFLTKSNEFPSGFLPRIEALLRSKGYAVEVTGLPDPGLEAGGSVPRRSVDPVLANGDRLRPHQEEACAAYLKSPLQRGVLRVATAGGKTHIAAAISRSFGGYVLGLVHGNDLLRQTHFEFERLLGQEIGLIGLGKATIRQITLASSDTIYRRLDDMRVRELLRQLDLLWGDEIHRAGSMSWVKILRTATTGRRLGLSGTPFKIGEMRDLMLEAWTGPLLCDIPPNRLQEEGVLSRAELTAVRVRQPRGFRDLKWKEAKTQLVIENTERTLAVAELAVARAKAGRKVFLFAGNDLAYADRLYRAVEERYPGVALATGQRGVESNTRNLRRFREGVVDVLVATVIYDEGIDVPAADVAILANMDKSYRQVMQRIGRILRRKEGVVAEVVDFLDETNPKLADHARQRLGYYSDEDIFSDVHLIEDGVEVGIVQRGRN